jgi:hypothetical protein
MGPAREIQRLARLCKAGPVIKYANVSAGKQNERERIALRVSLPPRQGHSAVKLPDSLSRVASVALRFALREDRVDRIRLALSLICSQQTKVQKTKHAQRTGCRKQPLSKLTNSSPGGWQSFFPIIRFENTLPPFLKNPVTPTVLGQRLSLPRGN